MCLDKFVQLWQLSENRSILNSPKIINIIEEVYKCTGLHSVVKKNDSFIGVPAFYVKSLLSGSKITSMPFNFYPSLVGPQNDEAAMEQLIEIAKSKSADCYVEYKSYNDLPAIFCKKYDIRSIEPSVVSIIYLADEYENQFRRFRKKYRSYLKNKWINAEKNNIQFDIAADRQDLEAWYAIMVRLYRDKHRMITQPLQLFLKLLDPFNEGSPAMLLTAKRDQKILAGIIILRDSNHWEYSWAAASQKYTQLGLNALLVDWAIRQAINSGVKTFGLGSSSPDDKALRFFKANWGSVESNIKYHYWNHIPKNIDLQSSFLFLRQIYSYLPLAILKRIPKFIVPKLV